MGLSRVVLAGIFAGAAILTSCVRGDPTGGSRPSWLRASVEGALTTVYEGNGTFQDGRDPDAGATFVIYSEGTGERRGQSLMLYRRGAGQPKPGRYELEIVDPAQPTSRGFTAFFRRVVGDTSEAYAARAGEIVITASDQDRIQGTFRFTAFRYNQRNVGGSPGGRSSGSPGNPAPNAPTIEVAGSFHAAPATDEEVFD
jgi:hypothetical protein